MPSLRAADVAPLPAGRFTEVVVPLYYEGHVYRAGSRIRITVTAPNGDQPVWSFSETRPAGTATVTMAHSARYPARLILPVVPGVHRATPLPPCPGLRGEPCRALQCPTPTSRRRWAGDAGQPARARDSGPHGPHALTRSSGWRHP